VIPRQLLGALGLGLLASLLAHAGLYGSDHSLGGDYHGALDALGLAALAAFGIAMANLAAAGRQCCVGSVLAARLKELVPDAPALFAASAAWFATGESIEGPHARASIWLVALLLAAATLAVRLVTGFLVHAIAAIAIAIFTRPFASRSPRAVRIFHRAPALRPVPYLGRRFARPPPARA
jgi:hypothetical protein